MQNPPQDLLDFEGEVLPLSELNGIFNRLGYVIVQMATDSNSEWERYITRTARNDIERLRQNPGDTDLKEWIDK